MEGLGAAIISGTIGSHALMAWAIERMPPPMPCARANDLARLLNQKRVGERMQKPQGLAWHRFEKPAMARRAGPHAAIRRSRKRRGDRGRVGPAPCALRAVGAYASDVTGRAWTPGRRKAAQRPSGERGAIPSSFSKALANSRCGAREVGCGISRSDGNLTIDFASFFRR
jgi:hypothetical protein